MGPGPQMGVARWVGITPRSDGERATIDAPSWGTPRARPRHHPRRAQGAAPRPPRRRAASRDDRRSRREHGYRDLPTHDADELAAWFRRGADRKSLELYLETFAHTVGVMQHPDAIARVAAECAEDLAADGVVYAEVRFAPELSTRRPA